MQRLLQLFNLRRRDRSALRLIGPLFALVTAANVVTISFAKALYIAHNPYESLPWMFICAALFTAVAAMAYVGLIGRATVGRRFELLLGLAVVTFTGLGFAVNLDPVGLSLVIFTWSTGLGQLIVIQTWSYSTAVLPTRQARRLFPVFAAAATLGAAGGGALTRLMLPLLSLSGLLFMAVLLLVGAAIFVHLATAAFAADIARAEAEAEADADRRGLAIEPEGGGLGRAFASLASVPLLRGIALLAFFVQIASVLLDFQFSSALKANYDADEMAGFLGLYYAGANLLTLFVALVAGSRITRSVGLGIAAAAAAIVLVVGSAIGSAMALAGASAVMWPVVATSFGERVLSFGVSKHAMQAAFMPLTARVVERAKFVIDGVVHRLATIVVSVVLLFASGALVDYASLSPFVLGFGLIAVAVGLRLGHHYRASLSQGLRRRRVDATEAVSGWAQSEARGVVRSLLVGASAEDILQGLTLCRDMLVRVPRGLITRLLDHEDPRIVARALETLVALGAPPDAEWLARLLKPDLAPLLLRASLQALPRDMPELAPYVEGLVHHDDPGVAALAHFWLKAATKRHYSVGRIHAYELALIRGLADPSLDVQRRALDEVAALGLPDYIPPLLELLDHPELRPAVMAALLRMPRPEVLAGVQARLARTSGVARSARIWLMRLAERCGGRDAAALLVGHLSSDADIVRNQAVQSLWRLTRAGDVPVPAPDVITRCIRDEIDRLTRLSLFDAALAGRRGGRLELLRRDVALMRAEAERRSFRLLGMITQRAAMEKAYLHYRDPNPRTRSNAIELVDSLLDSPDLKRFVAYIEATEYADGASQTAVSSMPQMVDTFMKLTRQARESGRDPVEMLLGSDPVSAWLVRLYRFGASEAPESHASDGPASPHDLELERLLQVRFIPLFERISGKDLLPVAQVARPAEFRAGEVVFEQETPATNLYLIVSGGVDVERDGHVIAHVGDNECFGEMGILDATVRSATVRAVEPTRCLKIEAHEFEDLLELFPSIAKGVIDVLTRRLRSALRVADERKRGQADAGQARAC